MRRELCLAYSLLAVLASLYLLVVPAAQAQSGQHVLIAQNIDVNVPAQFDQSVTFTGNNTHSGSETFTGLTDITNLNGVQKCDQFAGSTIDVQLNACIAAAAANSVGAQGIADATGLRTGTIAAQVNVGNNAVTNIVALLLPKAATWSVTITNGTSCGIMLYDKSAMIGTGNASNGDLMTINAYSSSTNVAGLVCTDPSPISTNYIRAEGFGVGNSVGATMGTAAFVVKSVADDSIFRDVSVGAQSGTAMSVTGACCGASFHNLLVDCHSASGCIPLVMGGTTTSSTTAVFTVAFFGASITHPGSGQHAITIGANAYNENVNFYNLYMEANSTDTSTALVEIGANAHNINFYGADLVATASGSTAYLVDIASWGGPTNDTFIGMKSQTKNIINDHVTGVTVAGDVNYGANAVYTSGTPIFPALSSNRFNQIAANQLAGVSACSSSTKTISFPITYTSQPIILLFDETTAGGIKFTSKSTSGFVASCTGASDAFDWMVIGNPN